VNFFKVLNHKILWRSSRKTSKHFAFVGLNFSKIGQEMTSVYFFFNCYLIWNIYGKIRGDKQLCPLTDHVPVMIECIMYGYT
jgi:hypothetical protein